MLGLSPFPRRLGQGQVPSAYSVPQTQTAAWPFPTDSCTESLWHLYQVTSSLGPSSCPRSLKRGQEWPANPCIIIPSVFSENAPRLLPSSDQMAKPSLRSHTQPFLRTSAYPAHSLVYWTSLLLSQSRGRLHQLQRAALCPAPTSYSPMADVELLAFSSYAFLSHWMLALQGWVVCPGTQQSRDWTFKYSVEKL